MFAFNIFAYIIDLNFLNIQYNLKTTNAAKNLFSTLDCVIDLTQYKTNRRHRNLSYTKKAAPL